jgi:hypothetical protein
MYMPQTAPLKYPIATSYYFYRMTLHQMPILCHFAHVGVVDSVAS